MQRFALGYEQAARLVLVAFITNLALLAHTIMGLVLVGFFPSLAATCGVFRRWLTDEDREWGIAQTWRTFHRLWKREFKGANIFGWAQAAIWALLLGDYWIVNFHRTGRVGVFVSGILFCLMVFLILATALSWVLFALYDQGVGWILVRSVQMVLARPWMSVVLAFGLALMAFACWSWPGLAVVFGPALPCLLSSSAVWFYGRLDGFSIRMRQGAQGGMATKGE